jgi:hypothetical protein
MIMNNRVFGLILVGLCASMCVQPMRTLNEVEEAAALKRLEEEQLEASDKLDKAWDEFNRAWRTLSKRLWSLWMADRADSDQVLKQYGVLRNMGFEATENCKSLFQQFVNRSPRNIIVFINDTHLSLWERYLADSAFEMIQWHLGQEFLFIRLDADQDCALVKKLGIACPPEYAVRPPVYVLFKDGRNYIIRWYHHPFGKQSDGEIDRVKNEIVKWFNREEKCAE